MRAQPHGKARGKGTKRAKAPAMAYFALHGTDLARAIAAGAIHAHISGSEPGRALEFADADQLPRMLGELRQVRDHGVVGLVEIARERLSLEAGKEQPPADGTMPYIPLALVSRILFQSLDDREEFRARASGYGDVPVDVLQYDVEPALFAEGGSMLFHETGAARQEGVVPVPGMGAARVIDKLAGATSAYLAAARGSPGDSRMATDFEAACKESTGEPTPDGFIRALALRLDPSMDNAVNANILGVAAKAIASIELSAGFNPDAFLGSFGERFEHGSEEERVARKFVDRAQSVLSGTAEVASDAFADCPGKTILRALLLFLLNPDASRLQSVGRRLGVLGPSVQALASSLAGCLAGFSSLPSILKAPGRDAYLAAPLLAQRLFTGGLAGFTTTHAWEADGSGEYRLSLESHPIVVCRLVPSRVIVGLGMALKGMGFAPMVDRDSGCLYWQDPTAPNVVTRARRCSIPVFPSREGAEIYLILQRNSSRRELANLVASINERTKVSGVFGVGIVRGKSLELELSVICDSFEQAVVERALEALASGMASSTNDQGNLGG